MSSHERVLPQAAATLGDADAPGFVSTPFASPEHWRHHARIEQRVIGQLLQTLLYEDVLPHEVAGEPSFGISGATSFSLTLGERHYQVSGWQCHSFRSIRLEHSTLTVEDHEGTPAPLSLQRFLEDLEAALGMPRFSPASSTS